MPAATAARAELSKADYEDLAALRYTLRLFLRFSEDAATQAGLAPQQHQALLAIKGYPGREHITIGELSERLQIQHHSAVGLVNRLVAEKLATRETSSDDRRKVLVSVTPRGERLLAKLAATHRQELRRIGPGFRALLDRIAVE